MCEDIIKAQPNKMKNAKDKIMRMTGDNNIMAGSSNIYHQFLFGIDRGRFIP